MRDMTMTERVVYVAVWLLLAFILTNLVVALAEAAFAAGYRLAADEFQQAVAWVRDQNQAAAADRTEAQNGRIWDAVWRESQTQDQTTSEAAEPLRDGEQNKGGDPFKPPPSTMPESPSGVK